MSGINQKEYLKRYLGIGKGSGEKKKKKKPKNIGNRLTIVDDDIDIRLNEEIQVDLAADNDEAPQIVSVIDDRPPSLRIDENTRSNLWKPIGAPEEPEESDKKIKFEGNIKLTKTLGIKHTSVKRKGELSPTRNSGGSKEVSRKRPVSPKKHGEDNSPPRLKIRQERVSSSEDISPPRKRSSPHQKNKGVDGDNSPPRRSRIDDISPPRKRKNSEDSSSPRKNRNKEESNHTTSKSLTETDRDFSPPRRTKSKVNHDLSPPRKKRVTEMDSSPPRKIKQERDEDSSPPRRRRTSPSRKKSRWGDSEEDNEKMKKTLDGKTAGLQNAAELVKETLELKKREDELFRKLSAEVSGANAATVVRKKKKEVDEEEEERKHRAEEENKEKYNRWGRGLKQVEDVNEKIKNDLYEMSKPLARYADDEDLERHLKDQEREGDPMLAYIRQKKREKAVEAGVPVVQQYEGDAPPNRFGIRPGYRWDGVDRSNGYEKKWFEVQNSRKATMEESYKWSTEDM